MITITDATRKILKDDDIASQALSNGILNLSAYAEKIRHQVENITFKEVRKSSIVVALSRITNEIENQPTIKPKVTIDNLNIKSKLASITYDKSTENRLQLSSIGKLNIAEHTFFAITQSTSEITIILPQELLQQIIDHFGTQHKAVFRDQVAVSVQFSEKYLDIPNVLYSLQAALAARRVNLTEVVSTYTEFCFILPSSYLNITTQILKRFMN